MRELVFLLEEQSAKSFLESFLPGILNENISARLIASEGKQDLEKQMTRKIRGYTNPNARFIIMRDQDSNPDCMAIKESLMQKCIDAGKASKSLVRIACKELETFYLADLSSVERALNLTGLAKHQEKAKFRAPDNCQNPSKELADISKNNYQKVSGSRLIGQFIDPNNSKSSSFKHLVSGIKKMECQLLEIANC